MKDAAKFTAYIVTVEGEESGERFGSRRAAEDYAASRAKFGLVAHIEPFLISREMARRLGLA